MKLKSIFILLIIILLAFFAFSLLGMGQKPEQRCPVAGDPAPDFILQDFNGYDVKLSDYKGKVIFLNFWATWCPPCRAEMPSMQTLHEELQYENFIMLAVSVDKGGKSVVRPFIRDAGYNFTVLLDPQGKAASKYGVKGIPTTFIINKDGKIVDKVVGSRNWAERSVIQRIRNLL